MSRVLQLMVGGRVPLEEMKRAGVKEVELLELLGVGAFGTAWKVHDTSTGKLYVLKIIQGIKPDSVLEKRVELEAGVAIPSEHVVAVVDLLRWDPNTFLILFEYFDGKALDIVLEERSLTGEQKKRAFTQILIGVSDAHRHNVIHRDLKPANILVSKDGTVKLIDFGISKFKGSGSITLSGEIIGTMPYMAPELLIRGAKVADARCDIYSLGHIFYELAMGQHFWVRKGWSELKDLLDYLTRVPSPTEVIELDDFHCDFFPDPRAVIRRMAKITPEQRYTSVDDVLAELGVVRSLPTPPSDIHLRSPLLIVESGPTKADRMVLSLPDGGKTVIGRTDIAGADESISRKHLEFSRSGDHYYVCDLESKNGTVLRGIKLEPGDRQEVRHADRIQVGDIFLRFAFLRNL